MATYGVTPAGFVLKRLADIRQDMVDALTNVTDPVTGESLIIDLSDENDPLVQVVDAVSDSLSVAWEQLQLSYNQFDPLKATDAGLSGLVQLNALIRQAGTYSTAVVTLTGTPGTVITAGSKISTSDGSATFSIVGAVLDGTGTATVVAYCTEKGPVVALAGTIVKVVTPIGGWTGVTNPNDAVLGTPKESDTLLRTRQQHSTSAPASSIIESIYGAVANLEAVTFARVYQNITDIVDARGISAHSAALVVEGGADADIIQILHEKMPVGVPTYGGVTGTVVDIQGITHDYMFSRPSLVPVYIDITVTIVNGATWPTDGVNLIKEAIVLFSEIGAGAIGMVTSYDQDGLNPGQTVYSSDFFLPVGTVAGTQINSIKIGLAASPVGDTVAITWDELASVLSTNIVVTVI